jgi:outer membrane protein assembly factor BamD (BamD/ComL family)
VNTAIQGRMREAAGRGGRAGRPERHPTARGKLGLLAAVPLSLCLASGCVWERPYLFTPKPEAEGPGDSLVLRGDNAIGRRTADSPELTAAHEVFRKGEYAAAQRKYHAIAENKKNAPAVAEEARYYEAECLRQQGHYPRAADTYVKMLNDFPSGAYREQAAQHAFNIANYWLDDTRKDMEEVKEKREGKRWWSWGHFVNIDKTKPILDEQGRAMEKLEQVRYSDMTGPLADKALFLLGSVCFFNENYKDADSNFSQLVEMHPNSPYAPQAVELAIISKHMSTGGSDYDGRKVAEARQLVHIALNSYPELAQQKSDFLQRQLVGITYQQAEKDYKMAQFYQRTGHPESAYFYYEIVRRRYPGTKYADMATDQMHLLRAKVEHNMPKQPAAAPAQPPRETPPAEKPSRLPDRPETAPPPRPLSPDFETAPPPRPVPGRP